MGIGQCLLRIWNIDVAVVAQIVRMDGYYVFVLISDSQDGVVGKSPCQLDSLEWCLVREEHQVDEAAIGVLFIFSLFDVGVAEQTVIGVDDLGNLNLCTDGLTTLPKAVDSRTQREHGHEGAYGLERCYGVGIANGRADDKHVVAGKVVERKCLVGCNGRHLIIIVARQQAVGQVSAQVAIVEEPHVALGAGVLAYF